MEEDNKKGEGAEEKSKSLIDRFWWTIPPAFLGFVYWPGVHIIDSPLSQLSFELYMRQLKYFVIDNGAPVFFWSYFIFGFMVIGYVYTMRCSSTERIIIPIFLGILGSFIGAGYLAYTQGI